MVLVAAAGLLLDRTGGRIGSSPRQAPTADVSRPESSEFEAYLAGEQIASDVIREAKRRVARELPRALRIEWSPRRDSRVETNRKGLYTITGYAAVVEDFGVRRRVKWGCALEAQARDFWMGKCWTGE